MNHNVSNAEVTPDFSTVLNQLKKVLREDKY